MVVIERVLDVVEKHGIAIALRQIKELIESSQPHCQFKDWISETERILPCLEEPSDPYFNDNDYPCCHLAQDNPTGYLVNEVFFQYLGASFNEHFQVLRYYRCWYCGQGNYTYLTEIQLTQKPDKVIANQLFLESFKK